MKYFELEENHDLILVAKRNAPLAVTLITALRFVKKHKPKTCSLKFDEFTFDIDEDSNIVEKIKDYKRSKRLHYAKSN